MKQHSNNQQQKARPRGRMPGQQRKGGGAPSRNQNFDSNGPSVRIRGSAHQVMEKYLALARDAAGQGDRVLAENYLQHAEHYFRIIQQNTQPRPPGVLSPAADGPQPDQSEGADDAETAEEESGEAVVEVIRPASRQAEPEPEDADPIAV